jgi:hypothetical protein
MAISLHSITRLIAPRWTPVGGTSLAWEKARGNPGQNPGPANEGWTKDQAEPGEERERRTAEEFDASTLAIAAQCIP